MAGIKLTKIELKKQKDSLKRFRRYLPTLYIKKQLLQKEVARINEQIELNRKTEKSIYESVSQWQGVFCEQTDLGKLVSVKEIITGLDNIAGIDIPVLEYVKIETESYDFFETPLWVDSAVLVIKELLELKIRISVLETQKKLLSEELRITSQRVNLFEKVKIPETVDSISKINIYLGDLQTVAAGWARMAKKKIS
ncbi:V-type ATP synthase subunit D [Desulforegula conservatrix]|uniref:V-type ATP synthase subunit D n=1 Tax=Desulforegula conservatrix TaxID=153026 RepID=UPI000403AD2E|nr:V-type ATP synthase subunit D [Desulforegula conservatrix]